MALSPQNQQLTGIDLSDLNLSGGSVECGGLMSSSSASSVDIPMADVSMNGLPLNGMLAYAAASTSRPPAPSHMDIQLGGSYHPLQPTPLSAMGMGLMNSHQQMNSPTLSNGSCTPVNGHESLASALQSAGMGGFAMSACSLDSMSGMSSASSSITPGPNIITGSHLRNNPLKLSPTYKRRKVPEGELCAVCMDLATGYHYGVASCNGCKTFFRRTIVSEQTFICQYNGNCDVNKNIRCACRHCRFNKCLQVGMDAKAIQNDRDRIGPTKKIKSSGSDDEMEDVKPNQDDRTMQEGELVRLMYDLEQKCCELRRRLLPDSPTVESELHTPSLLDTAEDLKADLTTDVGDMMAKELYPASMKDVRQWNIKEMRICLEWVKKFPTFQQLSAQDKMALLRNFAFAYNVLNRVYYSPDYGPDKIVYLSGAFILRHTQNEIKLSGCRLIYTRQMDEIMLPMRKLGITIEEFALFKAALFFNPDATDLSPDGKADVYEERNKYLSALFTLIVSRAGEGNIRSGLPQGVQRYGQLLMMTASIQNIIMQNEENMQVMELFNNWEVHPFVKELCFKKP